MKLFFKINTFFLIFSSFLFAEFNLKIEDVKEYRINTNELKYIITAKNKIMNNQSIKKSFLLINKENIVSNNIYYSQGIFQMKDLNIKFNKAYFLEGAFVMLDTEGNYKTTTFKGKKIVYFMDKLDFKDVFMNINNRNYKKIKYTINL